MIYCSRCRHQTDEYTLDKEAMAEYEQLFGNPPEPSNYALCSACQDYFDRLLEDL